MQIVSWTGQGDRPDRVVPGHTPGTLKKVVTTYVLIKSFCCTLDACQEGKTSVFTPRTLPGIAELLCSLICLHF